MIEKEKTDNHQRNKRQKETHKRKHVGFQPLPHISTGADGAPEGKKYNIKHNIVSITVREYRDKEKERRGETDHAMMVPHIRRAVSTVRNIQKKRWFLSPTQLPNHGQ